MIYAIRAVGTEYVKIGKANSVGQRLKSLETASPHELHIEAVAPWPDAEERRIHRYLESSYVRGEWYRDSARLEGVVNLMRDPQGLEAWQTICEAKGWVMPVVSKSRKTYRRRKDTGFFEPRLLSDPIERRRQEREEWWRKHGEHSPS